MLYFKIQDYEKDKYCTPIRKKYDLLLIVIEALQCILTDLDPSSSNNIRPNSDLFFILHKNKFSRLFFILNNKIFSIKFPFTYTLTEDGNKVKNIYYKDISIDLGVVSYLREALTKLSGLYDMGTSYHINDINNLIYNDDESCNIELVYKILNSLLIMEDGYLRYDHDKTHENGKLHPLHHYDIFYESGNTFKIGLTEKIEVENLIDFVDTTTDCHYIEG
ncbi:TPA: hypothetical protein ACFP3X_000131 [Neisseria subflava]